MTFSAQVAAPNVLTAWKNNDGSITLTLSSSQSALLNPKVRRELAEYLLSGLDELPKAGPARPTIAERKADARQKMIDAGEDPDREVFAQ